MIIKKFKNTGGYVFVSYLSIIVFLAIIYFISSIGTLFLEPLLKFGIWIKLVTFFAFLGIFFLLTYLSQKISFAILKKIDNNIETILELFSGEQIIFNKKPCLMAGITFFGRTWLSKNVIVTNQRIVIGFVDVVDVPNKKVGWINLWYPEIKEIPKTTTSSFFLGSGLLDRLLGGNTKIKDIAFGASYGKYFFIVRPTIWFPIFLKVYHPDAEKIASLIK